MKEFFKNERGKKSKTACGIRQESFIQRTSYPSCENNKTQKDRGRICLSDCCLAQKAVRSRVPHLLISSQTCLLKLNLSLLCFLHFPFFPFFLLCSSVYRKYPKHLSGESRRLPACHLCQRDGDQPQLRAPHPGRGSEPHPGQM